MDNPFTFAGQSAQRYVDVRPGYPLPAVGALLSAAYVSNTVGLANDDGAVQSPTDDMPTGHTAGDIRTGLTIADIGAGTGKLTFSLASHPYVTRVIAVEPSSDMREAFHLALPDFPEEDLLATTAEHTSLPDGSMDVVTYGQCWHWLDEQSAAGEAARILKPGGTIALFFNQLDVSQPWVKRLTRIMRSGDVHRFTESPRFGDSFTDPMLTRYFWQDRLPPEAVMALGTTRSSWIKSSPENRAKMQANLHWYLFQKLGYDAESIVELPYHTFVWTATRR